MTGERHGVEFRTNNLDDRFELVPEWRASQRLHFYSFYLFGFFCFFSSQGSRVRLIFGNFARLTGDAVADQRRDVTRQGRREILKYVLGRVAPGQQQADDGQFAAGGRLVQRRARRSRHGNGEPGVQQRFHDFARNIRPSGSVTIVDKKKP